jgi:hypothetical protein
VRVLEFINMVDTVASERDPNIVYKGRLEVYVLDQGEMSRKPVWMGPTPLARSNGEMAPHILPLIFNHEPEFPLRGISHASRILPQLIELNNYRSFLGGATRKDTRQYVTKKDTFGGDDLTKLHEGVDGHTLFVSEDYQGPLSEAIIPLKNAPLSTNIDKYLGMVAQDLERASGQSPQARGIVTKATAFEVQTLEKYSESDFGMHAAIKDEWLSEVVKLALRAMIASMQDLGDSDGAYEDEAVALTSVGAILDEDAGPDEDAEAEDAQKEAKEEAKEEGDQAPFVEEEGDEDGDVSLSDLSVDSPEVEIVLRDKNREVVVGVEDLDADFLVTFEEGAHTPMNDVAMQQNLVALMGPYSELWGAAQQGGAPGELARRYMVALHERFELPRDLHPDEMEESVAEAAENAPPAPDAPPEGPGGPPPGPGPGGPPPGPPEGGDPVEALLQMPPEQAIAALREMYADDPEMTQMLDQLAALPPEQAAEALSQLLSPTGGGAGPAPGGPPPGPPPGVM